MAERKTSSSGNSLKKSKGSMSSSGKLAVSKEAEVGRPKLKPENGFVSSSHKYDCCGLVIHCAEHNRILVSQQENVLWLPFTSLLPNLGWEDNAVFGFLITISGADPERYNVLKENSPIEEFKCLQVLRLQLPQTMKFTTRLIYYFRLKPNTSKFKCCQTFSSGCSSFEWRQPDDIRKISKLWGPEVIEFSNQNQNNETKISEYSLEEAFLYVPRDPPRNLEEDMLKTLRITEKDVERLYEDFLDHCFPSFYMMPESFKHYMKKYGFEQNEQRLQQFFRAFNYHKTGFLTFHEFFLGLACMEPAIQHGKFRVKFIFRFYSEDKNNLTQDNLKKLLTDIYGEKCSNLDLKMKNALTQFKTKESKEAAGQTIVPERDFVAAIGAHKFRGTSVLCRSRKGIFNQISRALAAKGLSKTKKVLSSIPIKRRYEGTCKTCKEKKYDLATHAVFFDASGSIKNKLLKQNEESVISTKKDVLTAQQYSIETVFYKGSPANIMLNMVRQFNRNKGTVRKPNGLLQDRKEDLWKLLLALYHDLEILLKDEKKCQKTYSPCYVMGDIHGNLEDLFSLEKALWKQIPCIGANYLFLGDYVDRGQWGFECSVYLFAFKILCPNKVTLLRGNHEVRLLQTHYTYRKECILKYGESYGLKIWELTNRIYDRLPVCALVDDAIYCAHGGLPRSSSDIEQICQIKQELRDPEREAPSAWEILWSDPCHMQQFLEIADMLNLDPNELNGFIRNTKRGTAFLFNETGCINFLRKNGLTHVFRAHEVPPLGYMFHFGNKCITIFSCSHYCGNDNDCACLLVDTQKIRVIHLDTVNNASATD